MNSLTNLIVPALFGLMTGVGHGIVSHNAGLPMSLTDQILQVMPVENSVFN